MTTKSLLDEYEGADFGDARLSKRLRKLVPQLSGHPGFSFPDATDGASELEATYRFLNNESVTPERILAPHVEATVRRAEKASRVVVAHDTTEMIFAGKSRRDDIGWSKQGNTGFLVHASLAIARSTVSTPLGVMAVTPFFRTGKARGPNPHRNAKSAVRTEFDRWWEAAEQVDGLLPDPIRPIHVMDREADEYGLFADLLSQQMRFVVRVRHNRAGCKVVESDEVGHLRDVLRSLETTVEREVRISRKVRTQFPVTRRGEKSRDGRLAKLQISAGRLVLPRPGFASPHHPKSIELNAIFIQELAPPAEVDPIEWMLFTSEPVDDEAAVLSVVDDYRARWLIEEYFKALKTGCAYEKRQLESREALLNALAVFVPIAWQLLTLRSLHRSGHDIDANVALSQTQIALLVATAKRPTSDRLNASEALLLIAALGGHLRNNGDPGWLVLSRGFEKLLMMEVGWNAALGRCDQS